MWCGAGESFWRRDPDSGVHMWTPFFIVVYQCIVEFVNRMEGFGGAFSDFDGHRR
jgi:hypothetical protein